MSNIYNLEPQAFGLILLKTTFGELELELFTKQCPKISKNFIQLCLDGYYNGTIFDRVEKDFIAIGGKLGAENESLPIETNPDEFHTRLKFSRRGLLATANEQKDANGAEFFFTLGPTPELQNKHSIFGRLKGDSIYHLVDLNECPVDEDLLPISEKKILDTIVKENPFPELQPRPEFIDKLNKIINRGTGNDDKLEEGPFQDYLEPKLEIKSSSKKLSFYQEDSDDDDEDDNDGQKPVAQGEEAGLQQKVEKVQDDREFKKPIKSDDSSEQSKSEPPQGLSEEDRQKRLGEIREKFQSIKKQIELDSATKIRTLSERRRSQDRDNSISESNKSTSSKRSTLEDPDLSNQELRLASKKGRHRERETLDLVESFKKRLKQTAQRSKDRHATLEMGDQTGVETHDIDEEDTNLANALELVDDDDAWLRHRFDAADGPARDAKDANTKGDDWYSIDDPRNPLVQRVEADKAHEYSKHRRREHADDERHSSRSSSRDAGHRRSDCDSRYARHR